MFSVISNGEHEMQIELTPAEAQAIRNVFFPSNPNKMRSATQEVRDLAKKMIEELEKEARKGAGA